MTEDLSSEKIFDFFNNYTNKWSDHLTKNSLNFFNLTKEEWASTNLVHCGSSKAVGFQSACDTCKNKWFQEMLNYAENLKLILFVGYEAPKHIDLSKLKVKYEILKRARLWVAFNNIDNAKLHRIRGALES